MQLQFSFKQMKSSNAVREYSTAKIAERVERYSTKPVQLNLSFSVNRHLHIVHCSVQGGDGFNFQVTASSSDMYGSIDILADKLETQLRRQKEKVKRHKFKPANFKRKSKEQRDEHDCNIIPIDAEDLLKYNKALQKTNIWKKGA